MFEFPSEDARPIWLASYPRSGNTFLRILLEKVFELPSFSIYYVAGAEHRDPSAEALGDAPRLPVDWREKLTQNPAAPPVIIKTHDWPADSCPAIFIARDGRAAIDSYFHYHQKFAFEQPTLTEIIAGACQFGSWSNHYWAWRPKERPKTLLLSYDELTSSPDQTVEKLAQFLDRKPKGVTLPAFHELQKRQPSFFRRGQNSDFLKSWSPGHLALFNQLHGSAMEDLGFHLAPVKDPIESQVKELAQSAARLHQLYLEQLTSLGRAHAIHQQQVQQLRSEIQRLSDYLHETVTPLLKAPWVRLGSRIGMLKEPTPLSQPPAEIPGRAENAVADKPIKSSVENTRSSSLSLAPGPLSVPNGDASARG